MSSNEEKEYNCRKCKDSRIVSDGGLQLVCALTGNPIPKLKYFPCVECNLEGYKKVVECYREYQEEVDLLKEELNEPKEEKDTQRIIGEVIELAKKRIEELTEELEDSEQN